MLAWRQGGYNQPESASTCHRKNNNNNTPRWPATRGLPHLRRIRYVDTVVAHVACQCQGTRWMRGSFAAAQQQQWASTCVLCVMWWKAPLPLLPLQSPSASAWVGFAMAAQLSQTFPIPARRKGTMQKRGDRGRTQNHKHCSIRTVAVGVRLVCIGGENTVVAHITNAVTIPVQRWVSDRREGPGAKCSAACRRDNRVPTRNKSVAYLSSW